jgi:hypothetical protein
MIFAVATIFRSRSDNRVSIDCILSMYFSAQIPPRTNSSSWCSALRLSFSIASSLSFPIFLPLCSIIRSPGAHITTMTMLSSSHQHLHQHSEPQATSSRVDHQYQPRPEAYAFHAASDSLTDIAMHTRTYSGSEPATACVAWALVLTGSTRMLFKLRSRHDSK